MTKFQWEAIYLVVDRVAAGYEVAVKRIVVDVAEAETVNVAEIFTLIRLRDMTRRILLLEEEPAAEMVEDMVMAADRAEVAEDEEAIEIIMTIKVGLDADEGGVAMRMSENHKTLFQWNIQDEEVVATKVAVADTIATIVTAVDKDEEAGTTARIVVVDLDEEIEPVAGEETVRTVEVGGAVDHAAMAEDVESIMAVKIKNITGLGATMVPVVPAMGQEEDLMEEEEVKWRLLFILPGATRSGRISE